MSMTLLGMKGLNFVIRKVLLYVLGTIYVKLTLA